MFVVFFVLYIQQTDDPAEVVSRLPVRAAPRFACFPGEEPQYFIFVESEVLCVCRSFSHALLLWFISHYIFNLEYSVKVKEVALFVKDFYLDCQQHLGLNVTRLLPTLLCPLTFKTT